MVLSGSQRRRRLERARLYLVCGRQPESFLRAVLTAGVDVLQLRDKDASDDEVLAAARSFRRCCDEAGALLIVNDRPDLAVTAAADGVHLGQDDVPVDAARAVVGPERIVGLSTHSAEQISAARGVDYLAVGPIHATPTKPGRPPVGLELVREAARRARAPFFAIGGIDAGNAAAAVAAGAARIAVVRAIVEADDPAGAARALRAVVEGRREATVGPA
ncbi:MAG: thiamine phosphate synthase [Solirubrobacteraceae bacterium]